MSDKQTDLSQNITYLAKVNTRVSFFMPQRTWCTLFAALSCFQCTVVKRKEATRKTTNIGYQKLCLRSCAFLASLINSIDYKSRGSTKLHKI